MLPFRVIDYNAPLNRIIRLECPVPDPFRLYNQ